MHLHPEGTRDLVGCFLLLVCVVLVCVAPQCVATSVDAAADAAAGRRKATAGVLQDFGGVLRSVASAVTTAAAAHPMAAASFWSDDDEEDVDDEGTFLAQPQGRVLARNQVSSSSSWWRLGALITSLVNSGGHQQPNNQRQLEPRRSSASVQQSGLLVTGLPANHKRATLSQRHRATTMPPAHVARRVAKSLATNASTSERNIHFYLNKPVYTRSSQYLSLLPATIATEFCSNGRLGVTLSNQTLFNCSSSANSTTSYAVLDAFAFQRAPVTQRANCTYIPGTSRNGVQCLCSSDYFLFETRPRFFGCLPRNISCATSWLGLPPGCTESPYARPQRDMDHCVTLSRTSSGGGSGSSNITLPLEFRCHISATVVAGAYSAIGAVEATPPNASYEWILVSPAVNDANTGVQPAGDFAALASNSAAFPAVIDQVPTDLYASSVVAATTTSGGGGNDGVPLRITPQHPLAAFGFMEFRWFDFNEPSRTDGGGVLSVDLTTDTSAYTNFTANSSSSTTTYRFAPISLVATRSLWNVTINISNLPDHFIHGQRAYVEVGLVSPFGLVDRYSVSPLEVEISDALPPPGPPRKYPKPLSTGEQALIAVLVALAIFLVALGAWYCWNSDREDDVGVPTKARSSGPDPYDRAKHPAPQR